MRDVESIKNKILKNDHHLLYVEHDNRNIIPVIKIHRDPNEWLHHNLSSLALRNRVIRGRPRRDSGVDLS